MVALTSSATGILLTEPVEVSMLEDSPLGRSLVSNGLAKLHQHSIRAFRMKETDQLVVGTFHGLLA